jgi:dynein light intermediate chain
MINFLVGNIGPFFLQKSNLDELIRQITVNCAERGLLLLRVRDEIKLTILSYQSLIESAIAYGIRKALLAERQQSGAVVELEDEKKKNEELTKKV